MMLQKRKYLKMFTILMFGVFLSMIVSEVAFSAPPGSKYSMGETLQPACDPGDANCSVGVTSMAIGSAVGSGTATSILFVDSSGNLEEDSLSFAFDDTNNQILLADGSVTNPAYAFVGNTDMGFYRQGSTLRYADGGIELLRIGVDGRIAVAANASGTITANGLFHATYDADTNSQDGIITVDTYSDDGYTTTIGGRRARGTVDSPSGVLAGDKLTEFIAKGYHSGGAFTATNRGVLGFYASEDYTASDQGTYFVLKTTREGTTANHNSLIVDHNGNAGFTYNNTLTSTFPNIWTAGDDTKHLMIQAVDDTADFGIFARSDSDTEGFDIWNDTSADSVYFDSLVDSASSVISFRTRGLNATPTTAFTILGSGNIGVGDISPSALFVVGSGDLFQVTSAGAARVPDGSAGAPSLSFTGDTDTGLYRSTINTLGFSTGGTSFATLDSAGVLGLTPSTGVTISLGDTAQSLDFGGTQSISSTTQTIKTGIIYEPTSNLSSIFGINNAVAVNNSSNSISNLIANRGAISLGATYTGTVADAIMFQARPITVAGAATINANRSFVAEDQTVGTSRYAYVGEQSSGANYWNLYMSGTADNYLEGDTGIGTTSPDSKLAVLGTSEQLRLNYDASNYTSFTTSSGGALTILPTGDSLVFDGSGSNLTIDGSTFGSGRNIVSNSNLLLGSDSGGGFTFLYSGNALALTLDSSQNATFAGDVEVNGDNITLDSSSHADVILDRGNTVDDARLQFMTAGSNRWLQRTSDVSEDLTWYSYGTGGNVLRLHYDTGEAQFTGDVTLNAGDLKIGVDNKKLFFGAGNDASIYYDGTDFQFDSQEVGSGDFIFNNGNVGIKDTTPDYILDVEDTSIDTNIFALSDSDGACLHNPESGAETVSCSSDERLKTNIDDAGLVLPSLREYRIREYDVVTSGDHLVGIIAQEALKTHPEIVKLGPDGYYTVDLPNSWILVKAIQELDIKFEGFTDLDNTSDESLTAKIKTFLSNAANGIEKIFVKKIFVEQLCVGDTCIDETQLIELLNSSNIDPIIEQTPQEQSTTESENIITEEDPEGLFGEESTNDGAVDTEDTEVEEIIDDTEGGTNITEDSGTNSEETIIEEETPPEDPAEEPSDIGTDTPTPDTSGDSGDTGGEEEAPAQ